MSSLVRNRIAQTATACVMVLLVALVLLAADADLAVAEIVLMLAVVGASVLGYRVGLVVAIEAFVLLSYLFAPPKESFTIDNTDDLIALGAFVTVSIIVGAIVARLNELRTRASLAAREAELRVRVTNELLAGRDPRAVADATCDALVDLFGLASCEFPDAAGPRSLVITYGRPLQPYELATLGALDAGLNAAFDRARLDAEAREHRVAAEVDRSRASFLAAMTHDLRTPLATIKAANAALLASDPSMDANDRRDLLDASYREASLLEQLVTTALELTRIHAGGLAPEPVEVSLVDLVRGAMQRLRPLALDREIVLDVSPELPAAYVDSVMLERAVENVLENALRHGPPDREIRVTGACSDEWVQLRVIDHGAGVAAEDRERVFEEFVQLGRADGSGVGLGLSITRAFVESNGGSVRFDETPGGGATLVLVLPAQGSEDGQ
jgi:two-component system sensor histidine kinase KdpD